MASGFFVCKHLSQARNTTRYQRIKYLSEEFNLTVLTFDDLPDPLQGSCDVRKCRNSLLFKILFPFWVVYHVAHDDSGCPDFIHTSNHKPALLAGIALKLLGYPWIADFWDEPTLGMQLKRQKFRDESITFGLWEVLSYFYSLITMLFIRPLLKLADLCIFVPNVYNQYGFSKEDNNLLSITNGVDLDFTTAEEPVPRNVFTIFYVGSVQKARGAANIISATEQLMEIGDDDLRVELVGPVPDKETEWLEEEIRRRELNEIIVLTGQVDHQEVLNRMAYADVCLCILSSKIRNYRYTYPIKLFEYMAMGRPIVCTDLPGTRNIIEDEVNGILVPPDDSRAISEAVQQLRNNPNLKDNLGEKALETASDYEWDEINKEIAEKIRHIINI